MQIVIDIPERIYDTIQDDEMISREQLVVLQMHILKGTPLPKGHGRLIDADVLCDYFWDNRSKLYTHKDLQIVIGNTPTIIEADTESEG